MKNRFLNKYIALFTGLALLLGGGCAAIPAETSKPTDFSTYLEELFREEVSQNAINLHFTLAEPEAYGITDAPVTLGTPCADSDETALALENTLFTLQMYSSAASGEDSGETGTYADTSRAENAVGANSAAPEIPALTTSEHFTYDVLNDYLHTQLELQKFPFYEEPLRPSTGIQAQLPILYGEYKFYNKKDVENYLLLLSRTDEYFDEIIEYEKKKADAGLFMSDDSLQTILSQCEDFIADTENHFLILTFQSRLDEPADLSTEEKNAYQIQNLSLLKTHVFPAYAKLAAALRELAGSGENESGLCYYEKGREYYEKLVYANTGFRLPLSELKSKIELQRASDLLAAARLCAEDDTLPAACSEAVVTATEPTDTLNYLKNAMQREFAPAPDADFTVHYIEPCMADYVAPAFYITAPLDDYNHNSIYINAETDTTSLRYFTTLAHEGFPGHLYQTVMSYESDIPAIRFLLNYPGYVEGWATYVELLAYQYADLKPAVASLLSLNQSALLSLYASSDIGIHFDGWTFDEMKDFWSSYGITDEPSLRSVYELIVAEPSHYLKYYVGYLGFLELRDYAKELFADSYRDVDFHTAVLKMGPAPFDLLKTYLPEYYKNN